MISREQQSTTSKKVSKSNNSLFEVHKMIKRLESQSMSMELNQMEEIQRLRQDIAISVKGVQEEMKSAWKNIRIIVESTNELQVGRRHSIRTLSDNLHLLSLQVSELAEQSQAVASEQTILKSLKFRQMPARHSNIKTAFPQTFDWIFENQDSEHDGCMFRNWLERESGIYWIEGKPGSGIWNPRRLGLQSC